MVSMSSRHRPIAQFTAGDAVEGFAFVRRREERQDKAGRAYLDLELGDASGSIGAKAWSDSAALRRDFAAGEFVKFRGQVQSYRDQLQLRLDDCRRATDADRADGFDEADLVPSTREDVAGLVSRLEAILDSNVRREPLRRLVRETVDAHGDALRVHPAAKSIHHAFRGVLLEHTVSMMELALAVAGHYRELDAELLLAGVLFHDLGKILELGEMPGSDYTAAGRLVGHIVLGRDLVRERAAAIPDFPDDLRLHLEHLVLSHQGRQEYGSPVVPSTPEALALHAIDDLDSKLALVRQLKESASGFQYVRTMERWLWLGEDGAAPGAASEPAADGPGDAGDDADPTPPTRDQKTIW